MAQKQFKIGLSNADKQNMAQDVYERVLALTFNEYDTTTEYEVGDFVVYNDQLYKCISATSGAWDSSKWQLATLNDLVTDIENAVAFVNDKANVDGNYPTMTVGNADQLNSTVFVVDKVPYLYRTSGGDADIGNREYDKIIGGSLAVNQKLQNGDFSQGTTGWISNEVTFSVSNKVATILGSSGSSSSIYTGTSNAIVGHKYLLHYTAKADSDINCGIGYAGVYSTEYFAVSSSNKECYKIVTAATTDGVFYIYNNNAVNLYASNAFVIDLTTMCGSIIADYIYSLEQANAGAGVAWFRNYFKEKYYPSSEGAIKNVKLVSHDMVEFNQWDEELEVGTILILNGQPSSSSTDLRSKNFIRVLTNTIYHFHNGGTLTQIVLYFYDANKNFIRHTMTPNENQKEFDFFCPNGTRYIKFVLYLASTHYGLTYNHDICINLSWSGWRNGQYEPYQKNSYPLDTTIELRGIPKLDSNNHLYFDGDEYSSDGKVVRKYGIVDLSTLSWTYNDANGFWLSTEISGIKNQGQAICSTYECKTIIPTNLENGQLTTYYLYWDATKRVIVKNGSSTTQPSGYLVYELETPTEENAAPFQEPQIVDDFGTEEYVVPTQDGWQIPVGHDTKYPANLRDKLQRLPDMPSVSQNVTETYVVNYNGTTKKCTFIDIASWLGTNGWVKLTDITGYDAEKTQTLKNVNGVLTWVDDE